MDCNPLDNKSHRYFPPTFKEQKENEKLKLKDMLIGIAC